MNTALDIVGLINILIGFFDILLGVVVLRQKKSSVNRAYFYSTFAIGIWSFALYFYSNPMWISAESWLKIVYIFAYVMTWTQLLFVMRFLKRKFSKYFQILLSALGIFFVIGIYLLLFEQNVIVEVVNYPERNLSIATMGCGYIVYFLPIIVSVLYMFSIFIREYIITSGTRKEQVKYYWIGALLMMVPLLIADFVLPVFFGNTEFYRLGSIGNILWSILTAYSIVNNRFLDVRVVIGNILSFISRFIYLFVVIAILFVVIWPTITMLDLRSKLFIIGLYMVPVLFLYDLFNKRIELFVRNQFLYVDYDPIEEVQKYSRINTELLRIQNIVNSTKEIFLKTIKPDKLGIVLFDNVKKNFYVKDIENIRGVYENELLDFLSHWSGLNSSPILIYSELKEYVTSGKKIIDMRKNNIRDFMEEHKIEIIVPIQKRTEVSGFLMLGEKEDGSAYSAGDISFIESIVGSMNISVGRALFYDELQDFNETLKQKVNIQTQELQQKVKELEEARRKESDMIDIMGHELRTPATIVKLNAQLLSQLKDRNNDVEFEKYLGRIEEGVEREIKLINTLLTSAKLEGDKIELEYDKVEIYPEVEMSLHAHEKEAKQKGLKLINTVPKGLVPVYGDHARIIEVINNLVSNAIKYTEEGSIIINAFEEGNMIRINVKDTGQGISKEDMQNLGKKFFRVETYTGENDDIDVVRPGGTGLGLYVVFSLVEKMGGKLDVVSEVGKGSIFSFTLPKYTDQTITNMEGESHNMFEKLGLTR